MPEERSAPTINELNLDAEPLKLGLQVIEDAYALTAVKQTFWAYEWFRSQNHDARWNAHDALYTGWLPPKTWEGTSTPRSSLGMPVTFSQIETAFPAIYQALFNERDWFQVSPEPGAQSQEADGIQAHLKYCLRHPKADYTGNAEIELELAVKQLLQHGNGGVEVIFDGEAQHPRIEWVDIRDFYIDPGCPVPSVDAARSLIRRKLFTIDELDAMREDPRMRIPDKAILVNMARNLQGVYADQTKQVSEALRGVQYTPSQHESSPLPSERKIEVLIYYSKYRIIWVLNREYVAYNEKNPYGFVPFCFAPCFPIPGRFYAMSYADVIENPQRYIEALYNARLDELSLALRPPRVRKQGSILTPAQQRWGPGQVSEAANPKDDVAVQYPQGATANVMDDISFLEVMVERLTGANSTMGGIPRPGNANRTATGNTLQAQGGASRIWPLVKHLEDYLIVPMLYKMYKMVQVHTHPGQTLPALGPKDQMIQVGAESFKGGCRFSIEASSKMLTRDKLAQMVPFLGQYILNGPFLQGIQATGQTVDFEVFGKMIQDATGTGDKYALIRPMNQQEQQAKQQPPPQAVMQQQQADKESQTRLQMGQMKKETEIQKAQIMKAPDPSTAQASQQKAQTDMMKSMVDMAMQKRKAEMDQKTAAQKMFIQHQAAQQKMNSDAQAARVKMFSDAAMSHQKLLHTAREHQQNLAVDRATTQQQLMTDAVTNDQKMTQAKKLGQHKMDLDKAKLRLQERAMRVKSENKPSGKVA